MKIISIFILKIKNTLRYKHNLILLTVLPALAAAGAWALLTFYLEGGANIPVGIFDYDNTVFSKTAIARFSQKSAVGIRELDTDTLTFEDAELLVQKGSLEAVLIINSGFSEKITNGEPEDTFSVICNPTGVARGIVAELFAAQVSRLYFNCDSANRVVRESVIAARSARKPPLTDAEQREIFDMAFAYCDSYWEPEPLMAVEYERYAAPSDGPLAGGGAAPGSGSQNNRNASLLPSPEGGWQDMREMLNDLIARAVFAIFFTYTAFCVLNAAGVMTEERAAGVLTRLRAQGFGTGAWIAVSAAAPFTLYGIPGAALLAFLLKNAAGAIFAFSALMCLSAIGAFAAYMFKKPGGYRVFTLICVVLSAGASIYLL